MGQCKECQQWKRRASLDRGVVGACCNNQEYDTMTFEYDTCDKFKQRAPKQKKRLTRQELDARES